MPRTNNRRTITTIRLSDAERKLVQEAADQRALKLASYVRMIIVPTARRELAEAKAARAA